MNLVIDLPLRNPRRSFLHERAWSRQFQVLRGNRVIRILCIQAEMSVRIEPLDAAGFSLLIASHPEKIEHISRNHRVAQEYRCSAGREKFIYTPPKECPGQ